MVLYIVHYIYQQLYRVSFVQRLRTWPVWQLRNEEEEVEIEEVEIEIEELEVEETVEIAEAA